MRNVTTYTNKEVVGALMEYHKKRMPYDEKKFEAYPWEILDTDGSWTVVVQERTMEVRTRVNIFKVMWTWIRRVAEW